MLLSRSIDETREMLATTLRSIGDAVITTDLEARVTFINPMAELLTGWSALDAIGRKSNEVFAVRSEDDRAPMVCPVMRVLESQTATGYANHTFVVAKDGTERVIAHNATPLRTSDGDMVGVVLVFHSARSTESLGNPEERLDLITRATNDAVWDWDILTEQVWWSDAVTAIFGYSHEDLRSDMSWYYARIHASDRPHVREGIAACLRDGRRYWQREYRFRCKSGSYSAVLERGYVLRDPQGRAIRMVGAMMDVTERREAQEELLRINAELERTVDERTAELRRANKELESFTYSVSHDLRTPLRNIIASSRILQEDSHQLLDDEAKQTLMGLVSSAKRMSDLIDDLLQYSRLSRSVLHLEPTDMTGIAQGVADAIRARGMCSAEITVDKGMTVEADPALVTILYENLIDNACKFSSRAESPRVHVGMDERRGERTFFVKDNGVGFDPADTPRLFNPFERLHEQAYYPGTGIGLANCERIVRRHGGRIWAEGKPGHGATFYFTL